MSFDLSQCQIRTPIGEDRGRLYRFLMDQFPPDRPLLQTVMDTGRGYYTWTPLALYQGNELMGCAAILPMRIWLDGRMHDVAGLASVATEPRYRRLGAARRLVEHCLEITDRRGLACVLFTSLPPVYQGAGFQAIRQDYVGAAVEQLRFQGCGPAGQTRDELDEAAVAVLARIYAQHCPPYTGKVERDAEYWEFYQILFHANAQATIVLCQRDGRPRGYARCEREADRLLVSEVCAEPREKEVVEALFARIADQAQQAGAEWVTLALPRDHFARQFLHDRGIALQAEPPGAPREAFMVRPSAGRPFDPWADLQWSLADKF